jgi:hypothetical protein
MNKVTSPNITNNILFYSIRIFVNNFKSRDARELKCTNVWENSKIQRLESGSVWRPTCILYHASNRGTNTCNTYLFLSRAACNRLSTSQRNMNWLGQTECRCFVASTVTSRIEWTLSLNVLRNNMPFLSHRKGAFFQNTRFVTWSGFTDGIPNK